MLHTHVVFVCFEEFCTSNWMVCDAHPILTNKNVLLAARLLEMLQCKPLQGIKVKTGTICTYQGTHYAGVWRVCDWVVVNISVCIQCALTK